MGEHRKETDEKIINKKNFAVYVAYISHSSEILLSRSTGVKLKSKEE